MNVDRQRAEAMLIATQTVIDLAGAPVDVGDACAAVLLFGDWLLDDDDPDDVPGGRRLHPSFHTVDDIVSQGS